MCVKRGKFLESVPLESDLEARLVCLTRSERGREDPGVLGGAQVLLQLAQPPIVDIRGVILATLLASVRRILLVVAKDGAAGAEILAGRVLDGD